MFMMLCLQVYTNLLEKMHFRFFENEFSNGTGCGNDVASDNPIIRKYIVDSIILGIKF